MKKVICNVMVVFFLSVMWAFGVCAADSDSDVGDTMDTVSYDMTQGGQQTFTVTDADGEESEIIVEELPKTARVANGSYKIAQKKSGYWKASFMINVRSNIITKAYQASCTALTGSVSNIQLQKQSDAQAAMTFQHARIGTTKKYRIVVRLLNKNLQISVS